MNITKINKYNVRECVFGLIWNIGYAIFTINYYCSRLILNKFFMCGQIIIIICNGEVRDRGKVKGG